MRLVLWTRQQQMAHAITVICLRLFSQQWPVKSKAIWATVSQHSSGFIGGSLCSAVLCDKRFALERASSITHDYCTAVASRCQNWTSQLSMGKKHGGWGVSTTADTENWLVVVKPLSIQLRSADVL